MTPQENMKDRLKTAALKSVDNMLSETTAGLNGMETEWNRLVEENKKVGGRLSYISFKEMVNLAVEARMRAYEEKYGSDKARLEASAAIAKKSQPPNIDRDTYYLGILLKDKVFNRIDTQDNPVVTEFLTNYLKMLYAQDNVNYMKKDSENLDKEEKPRQLGEADMQKRRELIEEYEKECLRLEAEINKIRNTFDKIIAMHAYTVMRFNLYALTRPSENVDAIKKPLADGVDKIQARVAGTEQPPKPAANTSNTAVVGKKPIMPTTLPPGINRSPSAHSSAGRGANVSPTTGESADNPAADNKNLRAGAFIRGKVPSQPPVAPLSRPKGSGGSKIG